VDIAGATEAAIGSSVEVNTDHKVVASDKLAVAVLTEHCCHGKASEVA
jgi:hypothetical protein